MPITTPLNEKANIKLSSAADSLKAGRKIVSLEELQTSSFGQTSVILASFAVDVANAKNLLVIIDGKILTEGASNDFTLTGISPNNTSNTISLTQVLPAGLNIKILYLGVVVTNSVSLDSLNPATSDFQSYPLTIGSTGTPPTKGTISVDKAEWRQDGDEMVLRYDYSQTSSGSSGSGSYLFPLPSGYTIDTAKIQIDTAGGGNGNLGSANVVNGSTPYIGYAQAYDSTHIVLNVMNGINSVVFVGAGGVGDLASSTVKYSFNARVPIVSWSSNVISQRSKIFKASDYCANGTNVSGRSPAALGEYRTYIKDVVALTATDNAPTGAFIPTSANGFRIDGSVAFANVGTSGQPNRIEVWIGLNKHPRLNLYSSTGRTGNVQASLSPQSSSLSYGVSFSYDPTTGVAVIDAIDQETTTTSRFAGRSLPAGGGASANLTTVYCDISVSDNVLPVQFSDPSKVAQNEVFVNGYTGLGSTGTAVVRFTNVTTNIGSGITYVSDSVNGDKFVINEDGIYTLSFCLDGNNGGGGASDVGFITKNNPTLTTGSGTVPYGIKLIQMRYGNGSLYGVTMSTTTNLKAGDVVRAQVTFSNTADGSTSFRITKIANG